MIILGIETSCDETALALVENGSGRKIKILSEAIHSQIEIHKKFGGVFPMMTKREHGRNLIPLLKKILMESNFGNSKTQITNHNKPQTSKFQEIQKILEREPELLKQFLEYIPEIKKPNIDAIAVTEGPGLEPALWVGINFATALGKFWNIPVIPINHIEGHILSVFVGGGVSQKNIKYPIITLVVSGGHTEIVLMEKWDQYKIIGETRDDAVGEAFDKVARIIGLPYPGGPEISKLAEKAEIDKIPHFEKLPRPMLKTPDFDFSFSGLKTSVLYKTRDKKLSDNDKMAVALEFQEAVIEILITKTFNAIEKFNAKTLILCGGVSANKKLREEFKKNIKKFTDLEFLIPPLNLSTDNAVMIANVACLKYTSLDKLSERKIIASGRLKIGA